MDEEKGQRRRLPDHPMIWPSASVLRHQDGLLVLEMGLGLVKERLKV